MTSSTSSLSTFISKVLLAGQQGEGPAINVDKGILEVAIHLQYVPDTFQ